MQTSELVGRVGKRRRREERWWWKRMWRWNERGGQLTRGAGRHDEQVRLDSAQTGAAGDEADAHTVEKHAAFHGRVKEAGSLPQLQLVGHHTAGAGHKESGAQPGVRVLSPAVLEAEALEGSAGGLDLAHPDGHERNGQEEEKRLTRTRTRDACW
eukprot:765503-Hanusia_phi.AAC.2